MRISINSCVLAGLGVGYLAIGILYGFGIGNVKTVLDIRKYCCSVSAG